LKEEARLGVHVIWASALVPVQTSLRFFAFIIRIFSSHPSGFKELSSLFAANSSNYAGDSCWFIVD
jgi:hypothetical protein